MASSMEAEFDLGPAVLALLEGDITRVEADAIVNAANSRLAGGGGVDGAIHIAGGRAIMDELDAIRARQGGCPTGQAVVTSAGRLPARWVIHAVGPVYSGGAKGEAELLASCYRVSIGLASERGAASMTLPSISTGIYGYPVDEAAEIALRTAAEALRQPGCAVRRATFVLFGGAAFDAHFAVARRLLGES